jgi:ADP-heptose:LPS heptosyltransferase
MAAPAVHPPRILILRGGAIGDFIVTLPVLQTLLARWPDAEIEIWGYPHIADLAVAAGLAKKVVSLDRAEMVRFFVPVPDFAPGQEAAIQSFDIILNYLHDPEGQIRSNLHMAGAKQVLSGSPIIKRGHAVDFLLEPLMALALYETGLAPALDFPPALLARGTARLHSLGIKGHPITIHPGSGSPAKNWPLDRYIDLIKTLRTRGHEILLVLGEADAPLRPALDAALPDIPRLDSLPLTDLAPSLAACALHIGNDSGITHLAAAVGIPVVALFGPTDPATWSPRGRIPPTLLRPPSGDLSDLPVSEVLAALP